MKKLFVFIIALAISLSIKAQDYQKLWNEYNENIENLLPESAEKVLNRIENQAFKDKNDIQLLKTAIKRCDILSMTLENAHDSIVSSCLTYLPMLSEPSQVIMKTGIAKYTGNYNDIMEYKDNDFIKTVSMEDYSEIFNDNDDKTVFNIELEPTLYDYVMHCLLRNYRHYNIEKELYEKLLDFDLKNNYIKAYYNNRIEQLGYISEKNYDDFSKLAAECTDNEYVAKIKIKQIEYLVIQNEFVQAKDLCYDIMSILDKKHPLYQQSVEFINSLTKKTIDVKINSVCIPNQTIPVGLCFRNTTNPSYKIFKVTTKEYSRSFEKEEFYKYILKKKPVAENTIEIPAETDYKEHSSLIALPPMQCGMYYLVFSNNDSFKNYEDLINIPFQVSNLAYFNLETKDNVNVYVVNRETGMPMVNVTAHFSERRYSYESKSWGSITIGDVISDANGCLEAPKSNRNTFDIDLYFKGDTLLSTQHIGYSHWNNKDNLVIKSCIFTDRAIYRPGQTVQFSCIVYRGDSKNKEVFSNYEAFFEFRDANNQIIDTLRLTTNEYGAVNGQFIIPTDRMNGFYSIREKNGSEPFRVEEYKRPTFEVTFDSPEKEFKVGDSITVSGKVAALSGFGLDGVKYSYKVTRKTLFPFRYWHWNPYYVSDATISTGKSVTLNDGSFNIDFQLLPSDEVEVINIPQYTYEIVVEATNKQGETQQGKFSVCATYNKYDIRLEHNGEDVYELECVDAKNLNDYNIKVSNIAGKPSNTKIECKIFKFNDLDRYIQDLGEFDRQLLSDQLLKAYFPKFNYYSKDEISKNIVYQSVIDVNGQRKLLSGTEKLKPGKYLIELRSIDDTLSVFYNECVVFDIKSKTMPHKSMCWTYLDKTSAQPGETINYYIGSSEKNSSALIVLKNGKNIIKSQRISLNNNIFKFSYKIREEDRGQLDIQVAVVKYNNEYRHQNYISVPYNKMDLDITLHAERDKILPGAEETLSVTIKDYKGNPVEVPLIATMYDASLDNFNIRKWYLNTKPSMPSSTFIKTDNSFQTVTRSQDFSIFRYHYEENNLFSYIYPIKNNHRKYNRLLTDASEYYFVEEKVAQNDIEIGEETETKDNPPVKTRKDFNETAFFYPDLRTDANGNCVFTFTMPDALTRWNLRLLAYSKDLKVGNIEKTFVTQQPVMIMADMPRFAYDEDTLWIAANVINMSEETIAPIAKLEVFDDNNNPIELILSDNNIYMEPIPAGQSRSVRWKVAMQKDINLLTFRFSAITDGFSDAEQHQMPVLSTDIFLTQAFSLDVAANSTKEFEFNIRNEGERTHNTRLNFNANPLYYAIHALPYLNDGDEKSAITIFNRLFVTKMTRTILENNPNIKEMLKNFATDTLSELQKNDDLKNISLKETPWVYEAQTEAKQRADFVKLFEDDDYFSRNESLLDVLAEKQKANGGWPWIEGLPESEYITQYILGGMGRLGIKNAMTENAFHFIENQIVERYDKLETTKQKKNAGCSYITMKGLYALSCFDYKTSKKFEEAKAFYCEKLLKEWKRFNIEEQAYIALILRRNGENKISSLIVKSLRERSIRNELGMYWRGIDIEGEARILEALYEIDPKTEEIDAMRLWLLKQKRTNMWESDRATVEAIFALMNRSTDWNNEGATASMISSNDNVKIVVDNHTNHVVWGGFYRQYFVPIDKVQQHNDAMKIKRVIIFEKEGEIKVGDKVKILITFENSQDMEFVYLKDLRGACFEPTEQLSRYHWSDGLWYYQSTSDVSMEYFIEYLPKGKHELSYEVYVTKEGNFSAGYSHIQCQYVPEFGAYSNGEKIKIGKK